MNKSYLKTKKGIVKVTFELPSQVSAKQAAVVGEFNNWDPSAAPMKRKKDGSFSTALTLESGKEYRYKYLIDAARWENDPNPDGLVPNVFGTQDSLITT
jgi:1,4-alpha-glucan branching enzyme